MAKPDRSFGMSRFPLRLATQKLLPKKIWSISMITRGTLSAPAPMYESYKDTFENAMDSHDHETLIAYKDQFKQRL